MITFAFMSLKEKKCYFKVMKAYLPHQKAFCISHLSLNPTSDNPTSMAIKCMQFITRIKVNGHF